MDKCKYTEEEIRNMSNSEQRKLYNECMKEMEKDLDDWFGCDYWDCFMLPPEYLTDEDEKVFKKYLDENVNNPYPYPYTEQENQK